MKTNKWLIALLGCAALSVGTGVGGGKEDRRLLDAVVKNDTVGMEAALKAGGDVQASDIDGSSLLQYAVRFGHLKAVQYLVKKGADVNNSDTVGSTPLLEAMYSRHYKIAELLLKEGAVTDATDSRGATPLHLIAEHGAVDLARQLVNILGVDIEAKDNIGSTPLHYAVDPEGSLDIVKLLLKHGAQINARNKDGKTPLHYARNKKVIKLLEEHGAKE